MKIICDRSELSKALDLAVSVLPKRRDLAMSVLPKCQRHVLLRASGSGVEVLATDLEVGLRTRVVRADVALSGDALLPAAKTVAIIRELEGELVYIVCEDRIATITVGGSVFKIIGGNLAKFPQIPVWDEADAIRFDRTQLEGMIRKTVFAAAVEGTRYYAMNGVLFDLEKERLRLVATDGKRLVFCERPVSFGGEGPIRVVVPTKGVSLLARLAPPEDETIALKFRAGQFFASSSRATLSAQLVQGQFPPYEAVIPKDVPRRIDLEASFFLPALRRASLLTTKNSKAVTFKFTYQKLTLSSRAPQVGESTVEVPVPYHDDPMEINFDPQHMIDALKVLDGDRFTLELKDSITPGVIRDGKGFTYVITPCDITSRRPD